MRVTLIRCPWWVRYCPPYILGYFAAFLRRAGIEVRLYDLNNILYHKIPEDYKKYWDDRDYFSLWENSSFINWILSLSSDIEKLIDEISGQGPELICFTTHTPNTLISEILAEKIKKKNPEAVTVFMGHKAAKTQMAFEFIEKPYIDYVCYGEADIPLLTLTGRLKNSVPGEELPEVAGFLVKRNGKIIDCGEGAIVKDLNKVPFPDYSDFKADIEERRYSQPERLDVLESRGCPNACNFCYERLYWKGFRSISGRKMFEQILYHRQEFPSVNYFYFNSLLLNGNLKALEEFCDLVLESNMKISWAGQAAIRKGMKPELLKKMALAGCNWLGFGVESGSDSLLKKMNKNHTSEDAYSLIKSAKEAGISVQINIIFGYPGETEEDFQKTIEFVRLVRPYIDNVLASQSFCTLEKRTYLKEHAEAAGIIDDGHHLFCEAEGGNTYSDRLRKYEEFCREALKMGIPETSGVLSKKPDKWVMLGDYYTYKKDYQKAADAYIRSLEDEGGNKSVALRAASALGAAGDEEGRDSMLEKASEYESEEFCPPEEEE
ncbi:MAG: radical SAM protein [Elusimicrobia bacterium]|nr:radical SAM protein [Elusimicrobiota bacterium]